MAWLLGLEFTGMEKRRVTSALAIGPEHLTQANAVQGGVVMAIADVGGALGAILNLPPDHSTTTIESKTNFLRKGSGTQLRAESEPVHVGRATSVWRTRVFRGEDTGAEECIAEIVQTQLYLPIREGARESAAAAVSAPASVEALPAEAAGPPGSSDRGSVVAARKRQVLLGACEVMARKGFAKSSVREIAEAAGLPIPTMYKYVRSKEDILALVYENFLAEFQREFRNSTAEPRPPMEQLELAIRATVSIFDRYHEHVKLLFRETKSLDEKGRERVYALDRAYIELWKELICAVEAEQRRGIDPELVANFVYYLTTVWAMRHWAIGKWDVERVAGAICDFVRNALQHRGPVSAATGLSGSHGVAFSEEKRR